MENNVPIIPNAIMLDSVIGEIQQGLINGLDWLDAAFGRAQHLTKVTLNGKRISVPIVYAGGLNGKGKNDYIEVSPDSHIGNFSFFVVDDPQNIDWTVQQVRETVPFSLIFWFDCRRVFNSETNRNTELVKAQIMRLLNGGTGWRLSAGRLRINQCFESASNVYRGFTLDEVDNQFLMHPFAGFRFTGELVVDMPCELPEIR